MTYDYTVRHSWEAATSKEREFAYGILERWLSWVEVITTRIAHSEALALLPPPPQFTMGLPWDLPDPRTEGTDFKRGRSAPSMSKNFHCLRLALYL